MKELSRSLANCSKMIAKSDEYLNRRMDRVVKMLSRATDMTASTGTSNYRSRSGGSPQHSRPGVSTPNYVMGDNAAMHSDEGRDCTSINTVAPVRASGIDLRPIMP